MTEMEEVASACRALDADGLRRVRRGREMLRAEPRLVLTGYFQNFTRSGKFQMKIQNDFLADTQIDSAANLFCETCQLHRNCVITGRQKRDSIEP